MTPVFSARRADEFDALLEGRGSPGRHDARHAEFLELVATLKRVPAVQPRPEFVTSLRERLMAEADVALLRQDAAVEARLTLPARTRPRRDHRLAAAAGAIALVGATTSMAVASQTAVPGDALYPVKIAIEDAHTGISMSDRAKGTTLLENASGRLDEVAELSSSDSARSGAAVPDTLRAFAEQTSEAGDLLLADYDANGNESSVVAVRDFARTSMSTLGLLAGIVPEQARDELRTAGDVLTRLDRQASDLCPTCDDGGITELPTSLLVSGGNQAVDPEPAIPTGAADPDTSADKSADKKKTPPPETIPDLGEELPPGSVLTPPKPGGSTPPQKTPEAEPAPGPLGELADDLIKGGDRGASTPGPLGPLTAPLEPLPLPLPDPLNDVLGDVVEDPKVP